LLSDGGVCFAMRSGMIIIDLVLIRLIVTENILKLSGLWLKINNNHRKRYRKRYRKQETFPKTFPVLK
jgi:hypothetical protein